MIDLDDIENEVGTGNDDEALMFTRGEMLELITRLRQAEKDAARYREIAMDAHGILVASGDNEAADAVYEAVIDVRNN